MGRNYVREAALRTSLRATHTHVALGESSTITVTITHTGPMTARVVDKIKSDVARHLKLEPAPAGWVSKGLETVEGDFPGDGPPDAPRAGAEAGRGTIGSEPPHRRTAAQRAADEE